MVALPDGSVSSAADSRQALRTADTWYESHPHAEKDIQWMCGATAPGMEGIERLPGGLGDGRSPSDFDEDSVSRGLLVELEHTPDPDISLEIVLDHLTENPRYYAYLEEMERKMDSATVGDLSPAQLAAMAESQANPTRRMSRAQRDALGRARSAVAASKPSSKVMAKNKSSAIDQLLQAAGQYGVPMTRAQADKVVTLMLDALVLLTKAGFTMEQAISSVCGGPIANPVKLTVFQQAVLQHGREKIADLRAAGMTDKDIGELFDTMHAGLGDLMSVKTNPTKRPAKRSTKGAAPPKAPPPDRSHPSDARIARIVEDPEFIKALPEDGWGDVKEILTSLVGNEADFLTSAFVRAVKEQTLGDFYIDTRVGLKPAESGYSRGKVTRADTLKALKDLKEKAAVNKKKGKPARSPAKATKKNPTARASAKPSARKSAGKGSRKPGKTSPTYGCPTVQAAEPGPLTTSERKGLPTVLFALPATRDLPLSDRNHAKGALPRLNMMLNKGSINADQYRQAFVNVMEAFKCFGLVTHKMPLVDVPGFPSADSPYWPGKQKKVKASKPKAAKPAKAPKKAAKAKAAPKPKAAKPAKKAVKAKTAPKPKTAAGTGGPVKSGRGRPAKVERAVVEPDGAGFKIVLSTGRTILLAEGTKEQAIKAATTRAKEVEFGGASVVKAPTAKPKAPKKEKAAKAKAPKAPKAKASKKAPKAKTAKAKASKEKLTRRYALKLTAKDGSKLLGGTTGSLPEARKYLKQMVKAGYSVEIADDAQGGKIVAASHAAGKSKTPKVKAAKKATKPKARSKVKAAPKTKAPKAPKAKAAKKAPTKAPKAKTSAPKSAHKGLLISSPQAFAVLSSLEGPDWARYQETDKLGPATFWANKMAFDVLVEGGMQAFADIGDVLDAGGVISGSHGNYVIKRGGEIRLLPGASKSHVEAAARLGIRRY